MSPISFPGFDRATSHCEAILPFSVPTVPSVVDISLYRVMRRCCEGGMAFSSEACGTPPCKIPTRIIDSSWEGGDAISIAVPVRRATEVGGYYAYVMCSVRVVVNATEKCSRGVFANLLRQQMATTGMLVKE
jgi:hypothetical protein